MPPTGDPTPAPPPGPRRRPADLPAILAAPARSALRRPWTWLAGFLGVSLLAASYLPSLEVRTDGESLHPADHRTVILTRQDRERFYEPEGVIVLARAGAGGEAGDDSEARDGTGPAAAAGTGAGAGAGGGGGAGSGLAAGPPLATWDDARGLAALAALHLALERLPETDADRVRSAATLLQPPRPGEPLRARTYLDPPPADDAEAARLVDQLRRHPLTEGLFLSADGRLAAFYLALAPAGGMALSRAEQLTALEDRLPALAPAGVELQLLGPAVAEARLGERVLEELDHLLPILLLVMAGVLALALRSVAGVLVPLTTAGVALLWTFAAMAFTGAPLTLVTTIVPVVLLAMAVTDEIHLLERLGSHLAAGAGTPGKPEPGTAGDVHALDRDEVAAATLAALGQVGRPIVLTSLTTAAGFLSFLSASLPPVRDFGLFVALGIVLAVLFTFTLVPALLAVLPPAWLRLRRRRRHRRTVASGSFTDAHRPPGRLEGWAAAHPGTAAALGLALLLALLPGIPRLDVQDSWIANFAPDSPLVEADRRANDAFWGTYRMDVVLEHPDPGFFRSSPGVAVLEQVRDAARGAPHVAGVVTPLLPWETLAVGRGLAPPLSAAPEDELWQVTATVEAIARRIDLRWFLTPEAEAARLRLLVRHADAHKARDLRRALEAALPVRLAGTGVSWHLSGDLPLALDVVDSVVHDQLRSIGWTLAAIVVLVILALRRPRAAVAVLVPPLAAVAAVLGGMGWSGLPLGIATSTFAALTLGVGVDFGIHLEAAHRRHRHAGASPALALRRALAGSGRALRWNTAVLATGFLVLTLSTLAPNRNLGLLLAAGLVASWLAAVLLLPVLLGGRGRLPEGP